jgi:hypothetical protein
VQCDDAYFFGKPEDLLLLEVIMKARLLPHGGKVRVEKGRWFSTGEDTMGRIPLRCEREVANGVCGMMVAGAPVGPPAFVRGVVRALVSEVISEMHKIKNALAFATNGQALFCLNRCCYASKLDHIIQMCYPSDLVGELRRTSGGL